jgi:hypothetical protein
MVGKLVQQKAVVNALHSLDAAPKCSIKYCRLYWLTVTTAAASGACHGVREVDFP